ncbi:unnamed protein product [Leptidea sinapis]|uniref:Uncharacterized protein n=1 Tax=Leptidea sinapis TaxID=189913 RepID=A0A5E4QUP8_9NEOP|nr:unnamed protein product [Leptidea sinapis]
MYLIEILIDKVTIFASEEDETSTANKNLIIKVKFGPKVEFIIKEGQLAVNDDKKDDVIECDENDRKKWSRTVRVGKSYLFPSYPDTILMILSKFPLEIEIWNDDENEVDIFIGVGTMQWDTEFFHMLKDSSDAHKLHEPLTIKQEIPLFGECYCKRVGEISFILRLSALGDSIITEFQQLMTDPDAFVFRTNKAPSMFQCHRIEGDDPNFCMVGSLYETTTLEDPTTTENANTTIEVCTQLESCGVGEKDGDYTCMQEEGTSEPQKKKYPIQKIRMGDIMGPCGNANCPLAHKIKTYIRNLDSYKKQALDYVTGNKDDSNKKVCGSCCCKDERWHREDCPEKLEKEGKQGKVVCSGCGGLSQAGETCEERKKKMFGTGATPRPSQTQVSYVFSVTKLTESKKSAFGTNYTVENVTVNYDFQSHGATSGILQKNTNKPLVYNVEFGESSNSKRKIPVNCCTETGNDNDCKCSPPKPSPPCKTFDCSCIQDTIDIAARKAHKPYCPQYKHRVNCPVNLLNEDEEKKEEEEDEVEPLPYGLPRIKLGPCPILGRPCSVPDGFARMYKTAAQQPLPPSYSDAGKVCCSKEYERIKKAIKEYMKNEKDDDFRCINKFNVDTERRCCDKEQVLLALMGKGCCGAHKLAIQEEFKDKNKK